MKLLPAACLCVFVSLCVNFEVLAAEPSGTLLLPAHGLYGLPAKQGQSNEIVKPLPHIHKDFLKAIGYEQGAPNGAINWFNDEVKRLFGPSVIDTISPKNKYRTYAVSIQVTRADQYFVDKEDGTTDIYLPVAVNVFFTNILTGEVIYSGSKTEYTKLTESQEDFHKSGKSEEIILPAYKDKLNRVITSVLIEASTNFKPLQISAVVVDQWKGYLILNKGLDAGISVGQQLTNVNGDVKIIHSGKSYSIGTGKSYSTSGNFQNNDVFSFFSTASANDVKKPRVLIIDADTPSDIPGNYASTQFAEELGGKASFTIIPVNPDFSGVLRDIASNQGVKQAEVTQSRELPNYFLRIKVLNPIVYELVSNHDYGKQRVFEGTAFAELLDKTGRVLYASEAHEEIRDVVISNGMAFDLQDRNKVLYGNLLKTLSQKFINDVRFSRNELQIKKVTPQEVIIQDQAGLLSLKQSAFVMHKLGKIEGIHEDVVVPTWGINVVERSGSTVTLQPDLQTNGTRIPIQNNGEDFVIAEGSGKSSKSRLAFVLCDESKDIGTIHLPELKDLTYFALGKVFQQPYFGADYPVSYKRQSLTNEIASFDHAGFKNSEKTPSINAPYCLSPLLKVTETARQCSEENTCDVTLNIVAGIQALSLDKVKGPKKVLGIDYKVSGAPAKGIDLFIQRKVLLKSMELMPEVIKQLDVSNL